MNIFFLHKDPLRAAKAQCDKHVVKMVLETAQMLSTGAHKFKYINTPGIYKPDKSEKLIQTLHALCGSWFTFQGGDADITNITEPPQCMPDEFKCDDYVRAYRNYYIHKIGEWKHPPKWFKNLDADPYYANV